jgi:LPS export ABC transporter protein LptC
MALMQKSKITAFLWAALLPGLLMSCAPGQPAKKTAPSGPAGPDQVFLHARFVVTENGLTNAIVRADSVLVFQGRQISEADGSLLVDFFSKEGKKVSTLTARRGIIYGMTEEIDSLRAEGDVKVVWLARNATMNTPYIRWISATRRIYADSTVTLEVEDATEQGVGFEAPDDLKSYSMREVTGVVQSEKIKIPKPPVEKK